MLTYHLRDETGALAYCDQTPVTVTVSPPWAPRSHLPDGPRVWIGREKLPGKVPSRAELDRVTDRVHGWTGVQYLGELVPCSRSVLRAALMLQPWLLAEVRHAIALAAQSGVLV